jgi:hypothetical protein
MIRFFTIFILFKFIFIQTSKAQLDSITLNISVNSFLSSENFQPHYARSNRHGTVKIDQNQVLFRPDIFLKKEILPNLEADLMLDLVLTNFTKSFLQQYYLELNYHKKLYFFIGAKEYTIGLPFENLTTGSLALSNNARPLPRISIGFPDFVEVPFTFGYLEIKGILSHGWFEKDRITESPFLHEKFAFARIGGKLPVRLKGGITHFAQWGGERDGIVLPSGLKDYLRIITARPGPATDDDEGFIWGESANALGNHLGTIEFGMEISTKWFELDVYHQTPFEDNSGTKLFWKRNGDRLMGFHFKPNSGKIIESFLYEYVYTKQQTHPGLNVPVPNQSNYGYGYGGRDNYYNNYLYKSGWTYKNSIMGTPLFDTQEEVKLYAPDFIDPDSRWNFNIANNRIIAHHLGVSGNINTNIGFRFLSTYTKNFGTYGGINGGINRWGSIDPAVRNNYFFYPPLTQLYFLLESEYKFVSLPGVMFNTALALDNGSLSKNASLIFGVKFTPELWEKLTLN